MATSISPSQAKVAPWVPTHHDTRAPRVRCAVGAWAWSGSRARQVEGTDRGRTNCARSGFETCFTGTFRHVSVPALVRHTSGTFRHVSDTYPVWGQPTWNRNCHAQSTSRSLIPGPAMPRAGQRKAEAALTVSRTLRANGWPRSHHSHARRAHTTAPATGSGLARVRLRARQFRVRAHASDYPPLGTRCPAPEDATARCACADAANHQGPKV